MMKITAEKTMFASKLAETAPMKAARRKTESGTSGSFARDSTSTKRAKSAIEPPK